MFSCLTLIWVLFTAVFILQNWGSERLKITYERLCSGWVGELGPDLRSLSCEAHLNHWALLLMFSKCLWSPSFSQLRASFPISNTWCIVQKWVRPVILTVGSLNLWRSIRAIMRHLKLFPVLQKYLMCIVGFPVINLLWLTQHEPLPRVVKASAFACRLNLEWHLPALPGLAGHFHEPGSRTGTLYTLINQSGEMISNGLLDR